MRRFALFVSLSAAVLTSACSDRTTSPGTAPVSEIPRNTIVGTAICVSDAEITALLNAAFENGSPDEQSALGKWSNIQKQKAAGDRLPLIQEKVIDLADFMLTKKRQGKLLLGATEAELQQFARLINALFCYAELNFFYPGGDAWFIFPSDAAQTIQRGDGQAAMRLPANAVLSPSLVAITRTDTPLNTKLDKYGQNYDFSKYPANEPFAKLVITDVCASVPASVYPELVLGHNKANGEFELLPKEQSQLACLPPAGTTASVSDRLLAMVLPRALHAAVLLEGGGVAGSVIELSPIGPVDPRIIVTPNFTNTTAPIGTRVAPAPSVTLTTPLGVAMDGVRVDFAAAGDATFATGATVSPSSGLTDATGTIAASWRLGTATTLPYALRATPQLGGLNAVSGTDFVADVTTFTANALPAAGLQITATPATATAGTTLGAFNARIVDVQNRTVEGYAGTASLTAPTGVTIEGTTSRTVIDGLVSFTGLVIKKAGTHALTMTANPTGTGAFVQQASVTIAKGAPLISIVSGDNQQATAPATLGNSAPFIRVRVADAFDNPYEQTSVYWRVFDNSAPDTLVTTTGINGISGNSWRIQENLNQLYASLDATALTGNRFVMFTATGIAPRRSESLLSCSVGNSRVPMLDHYVRISSPSRIDKVTMYFSVQGDASTPSFYPLVMKLEEERRVNGNWVVTRELARASKTVALRGNTAQNDGGATFEFTGAIPASGSRINIRVEKGDATPGTLRFNAGTGSNCNATTIGNNFLRASAGIVLEGVR